ncbi:glycerol-3-phosphate acyltransferase [Salinispira pacifica]
MALVPVWIAAAYLYGSVNFAIIFTRLRAGKDIRSLGNRNAGAANVKRNIGFLWGFLVFVLDISKSALPIWLADLTLPATASAASPELRFAALLAVGIAAIIGHCKPIYYGFRGGRGIATSIGIYAWFVPLEMFAAMLVGAALVMLIVRNVPHRLGPYTPITFVSLTPFFALGSTLAGRIRLTDWLTLGGHPWYLIAGIFALSLIIFVLNLPFLRERREELQTAKE